MNKPLLSAMALVSERRSKLLAEPEKLEEHRKALDAAEVELRKAIEAALVETLPVPDLPKKVEVRNYMSAAMSGTSVKGAEAELNQERGLDTVGSMPWDALLPPEEEPEKRQDVATTVASAAIGHPQESVLARIFKMSRLSFLGARMPSVASGEPIYPVMTGGTTGSAHAAGDAVDAAAATFTGETVGPTRLSARYKWRIEDSVRFPVEEALRSDLRMVMSDVLDEQVFNGNAAGANMDGLFRNHAGATLGASAAEGTKTDYDQVLTKVYGYVDGAAAGSVSDVRTLIGVATNTFLATVREANGAPIFQTLGSLGAPFAVSAHVPAAAGNVQQAIQTRRPTDLVIPVWQGVTFIRDPYSDAASAEVTLTAHYLANLKLLRSDHWRKIAFKLA